MCLKLNITRPSCDLITSRSSNKELNLLSNDNPDKLKIMHCILVNKSKDKLAKTRCFWMKVGKELLLPLNENKSCINTWKNLWQGVKFAHDRWHKKRKNNPVISYTINNIEEEEENAHNDMSHLPPMLHPATKNWSYKPCI